MITIDSVEKMKKHNVPCFWHMDDKRNDISYECFADEENVYIPLYFNDGNTPVVVYYKIRKELFQCQKK